MRPTSHNKALQRYPCTAAVAKPCPFRERKRGVSAKSGAKKTEKHEVAEQKVGDDPIGSFDFHDTIEGAHIEQSSL